MYGPPTDCKRFEVSRRDSLRKCIRPLSGESFLRALDDDPRVPVLLNPSVTRDAFECPGFPARRWTVLSSPSLLSRPWWNFCNLRRRGGGKVESVLCFSSAASFPRPSSGRWLQRLMSILFTAGQHSPGHASQLVRDRDHDFVARSTLSQPMHPLPESSCVVLNAKQYRAGTVDQHTT